MGRLARAKKCERAIQNTKARTGGQDAAPDPKDGKVYTERVPLSRLNPAPYNPRKDLKPNDPEYIAIKRSITEFGLVENLVWNKRTGNLVGGHQRLKVLKELGYESADVAVVDLPIKQEKALNIVLNKAQGEWDIPRLKELLVELDDGEFDLASTGFSEEELKRLIDWEPTVHAGELGETPDDLLDTFLNGAIKQIVLYFDDGQYQDVVARLKKIADAEGLENNTEVFLALLKNYENDPRRTIPA